MEESEAERRASELEQALQAANAQARSRRERSKREIFGAPKLFTANRTCPAD